MPRVRIQKDSPREKTWAIEISNRISELQKLSGIVDEFNEYHELQVKVSGALNLALDDMLSNTIRYGYEDQEEHKIRVHMSLVDAELIVEVTDDARPFNPLTVEEPETKSSLEERQIGGLGIHLVRNLMDSMEYSSQQGENCLVMKKKIN